VHQGKDHILPARLDQCLQPVNAPKIEQINMRPPENDTDIRRNY